tara:strand:- start:41316 stop:41930 length:615 start_codon:yes stop_codon:yes gene_type:complete
MALFLPTYFSPISQYGAIMNFDSFTFEIEDNFQKQTYRNRCYIYGANGKQILNIPLSYPKTEGRKKTKDILVEDSNWQTQHYKSLKIAYSHSPFFEFYKDDLQLIFEKKYKYLLDVTLDSFLFINDALDLAKNHVVSKEYNDSNLNDFRHLASAKSNLNYNFEPYIQMFDDKYGFLENLSILDLLFMEGPNSISFLEKVNVTLK